MHRTSTRTSGDRVASGILRSVIDSVNDSPFMQSLGIKIRGAESSTDVEHWHPFGSTAFPMGKTTDEQAKAGMMKGAPEVLLQHLMGNQSHPVAMPAADRRFRPNGMKAGEHVLHDAFKQFLHFGKAAATLESPKKLHLRIGKEKQQAQSANQGGSANQQKKKNNGADVAAEKDIPFEIVAEEDGSWTIRADKPGKIVVGQTEWQFDEKGLTQKGGEYVKHDDRHIGKGHKHGGVMAGAAETAEPLA